MKCLALLLECWANQIVCNRSPVYGNIYRSLNAERERLAFQCAAGAYSPKPPPPGVSIIKVSPGTIPLLVVLVAGFLCVTAITVLRENRVTHCSTHGDYMFVTHCKITVLLPTWSIQNCHALSVSIMPPPDGLKGIRVDAS